MARILFPEFRDENRTSWYPFADETNLVTETGFEMAKDAFLDASIYPIGGTARMRLGRVSVTNDSIVFVIVSQTGQPVCSGEFDKLHPPDLIDLADDWGRPAGVLVCDPVQLATFQTWSVGEHSFKRNAAEFVASVTIPTPEIGLRGILTEDGDLLTGDVWIVGDGGVVVRADGDHTIRVDVVGDPLYARRLCQPFELFATPNFIQTINGVEPDEYGNFMITVTNSQAVDTALRIYPVDASTLRVEVVGSTVERR